MTKRKFKSEIEAHNYIKCAPVLGIEYRVLAMQSCWIIAILHAGEVMAWVH